MKQECSKSYKIICNLRRLVDDFNFKNTIICVPFFMEKFRIVSIFDTFEASFVNMDVRLKKRTKQREYLKNQLLAFE